MNMKKIVFRIEFLSIGFISILTSDFTIKKYDKTYACEKVFQEETIKININKTIKKIEDRQETNNLINYYSNIYNLNKNKINDKIIELTNYFENDNWYQSYQINNNTYNNKEIIILLMVRDIYENPNNYNLTKEEIIDNINYNPTLSCEELVEKYCKMFNINKDIALSIIYTECGSELNSYNYLINHNPAGMGPNFKYNNIEHGIITFILLLKENYNCTLNSDEKFLYNISNIYCTEETENWINNSVSYYNNIKEKQLRK